MDDQWKIRVFGARGSCSMAGTMNSEYGTNTSCMAVEMPGTTVVFDAGSGLIRLGAEYRERSGPKRLDLFLSHVHIDHIIGLFGFPLFFHKDWEIHLYGEAWNGMSFDSQISKIMSPPYWPIGTDSFTAAVKLHEIRSEDCILLPGNTRMRICKGFHPDGSLMFRLDGDRKSIVYGLDCEINEEMEMRLPEFSREADVLIFDASYMPEDMPGHEGWGHSDWKCGLRIGEQASVKTVLMSHFSWEYTDEVLKTQEKKAEENSGKCVFAKEGMEIRV